MLNNVFMHTYKGNLHKNSQYICHSPVQLHSKPLKLYLCISQYFPHAVIPSHYFNPHPIKMQFIPWGILFLDIKYYLGRIREVLVGCSHPRQVLQGRSDVSEVPPGSRIFGISGL